MCVIIAKYIGESLDLTCNVLVLNLSIEPPTGVLFSSICAVMFLLIIIFLKRKGHFLIVMCTTELYIVLYMVKKIGQNETYCILLSLQMPLHSMMMAITDMLIYCIFVHIAHTHE